MSSSSWSWSGTPSRWGLTRPGPALAAKVHVPAFLLTCGTSTSEDIHLHPCRHHPPTLTHHISTRHNHPNTQPTAHHYRHNYAPTTPTQDIEIEIRALPDDMSKLIPDFIDRTLAKLLTLVVRCAELRVEFDSAWGLIVLWVGSVWSCVYVAGPHRAGSQRECETCRGLRCAAAVLGGAGSGQLLGCSSSKQPASKPTLPTLRSPALCPLR